MLKDLWRLLCKAFLVIGVALSFFAILEIMRAHQTLRNFHPMAGHVFLGALVCAGVWLTVLYAQRIAAHPPALAPPQIPERSQASRKELRRYARYLAKYLKRLSFNDFLSEAEREKARASLHKMDRSLNTGLSKEEVLKVVEETEGGVIRPILSTLNERAQVHVTKCVRDVMLGVAVSPYRAADLMIVIYRNAGMIAQIVRIYHARPRLTEQMLVFRDVLRVIAFVNYTNLAASFVEKLSAGLPLVGKGIDDALQGLGAGILTSLAGHAAMERCRSFQGWNEEKARSHLVANLSNFMVDCKRIADPIFSRLFPAWTARIGEVLDQTAEIAESFVKRPALVVGTTGRRFGSVVTSAIGTVGKATRRGTVSVATRARNAGKRLLWWRKGR